MTRSVSQCSGEQGQGYKFFTERTVKLVLREETAASVPRYIIDFSDRLIIQSTAHFRGRAKALEVLFKELPSRLSEYRVRLVIANELPPEVTSQVVKREMKFSEIVLFGVTTEYTDRLDSLLKSTRVLRLGKCHFRQIFPKEMTNETSNEVEVLQMEEVDFRVSNSLFIGDRIRSILLSQT